MIVLDLFLKVRIKGLLVQGFLKNSKNIPIFGFWKISNNLTSFMEELLKEPKLWGLGSLTNSFGFFRSTIMIENWSFDFLKIAGHGSMMPRPYLPIFSSKRRIKNLCYLP